MKELPSNEFRKTFASLREPVTVTVHGHPIAIYTPVGTESVHWSDEGGDRWTRTTTSGDPFLPDRVVDNLQAISAKWPTTQEFRPAPKPTRKRK